MNTLPQPSVKSLVLACVSSILIGAVVLVVAVLPAEYNIDPTGLGSKLGLTVLAQTEKETTAVVCAETADVIIENHDQDNNEHEHEHEHEHESHSHDHSADQQQVASEWLDTIKITVPAGKGIEYKFYIKKGEKLAFVWNTMGEKLYYDFHGEPEGDKTGYFKSFKMSTENESSGTLTVPFSGSHGWYWENKTNQPVDVILKTSGQYKKLGLM